MLLMRKRAFLLERDIKIELVCESEQEERLGTYSLAVHADIAVRIHRRPGLLRHISCQRMLPAEWRRREMEFLCPPEPVQTRTGPLARRRGRVVSAAVRVE